MLVISLSEVADVIDCEHKTAPTCPGGVFRSIRTTDISRGVLDIENANRIDELTFEQWTKRGRPEKYDLILAREAPVGEVGIVPEDNLIALGQRTVLIKITDPRVNPKFLNYYLGSRRVKHDLKIRATGSVVDHLNMSDIRSFPLHLPSASEQEAIAEVLSSLDDKIDLLKRQNKTLEGMAEALFRQWFIEEAQDDWEEVEMGELVEVVGGATPKTSNPDFWDGDVAWTSPRDATRYEGLFLLSTDKTITQSGLGKISSGVLPRGTILMTSRAPVGRVVIADLPLAINQGYIAFSDIRFVTKSWLYFWLSHHKDLVLSFANGSTFLEVSKRAFRTIPVTKPDQETLLAFDSFAKENLSRILSNEREIRLLQKQRDTLLPKLMSGEVRVNLD